ncbi:MAG: NAD(P)H-dependent oxidoreductase [Spirochaetes bacterium]|nr:NAD(P)H-dependent oxidoreductase [Spirochaetota bacterium]MBN2772447.1 NAD(P)H-dependent oxidoreductase [Spirochaetota bacterium]
MRLTVINASPRLKTSNTAKLLDQFLKGFCRVENNTYEIIYYNEIDSDDAALEIFKQAENILLAFPLYSYGLPPSASRFVYRLSSLEDSKKRSMGFFCQYGFNEACHARSLERQLENMCHELKVEYLGMLIRGGCEGLRYRPESANRAFYKKFEIAGSNFGQNGRFIKQEMDKFSAPEFSKGSIFSSISGRLFVAIGNFFFWRVLLKKNGALHKHWDRPLQND